MLIFGMTPHSHMYFDFEHHIISMYSVDDRIHLTQPKHSTGDLLYLAHSAGPWPKNMWHCFALEGKANGMFEDRKLNLQ